MNGTRSPRAVFLDRDGTINVDRHYLSKPEQFELVPGAGPALRRLQDAGFLLIVVTNQSGIGRGYYTEADLHAVNARMNELLAPLGVRFLRHSSRPVGYERAALVALHGSWNRSTPAGYKVVSLHFAADGSIEERDFLTGFRNEAGLIGRPVDVAEADDGSIYVSDDYAGVIYRVTQ